jgi:hypothetical protein
MMAPGHATHAVCQMAFKNACCSIRQKQCGCTCATYSTMLQRHRVPARAAPLAAAGGAVCCFGRCCGGVSAACCSLYSASYLASREDTLKLNAVLSSSTGERLNAGNHFAFSTLRICVPLCEASVVDHGNSALSRIVCTVAHACSRCRLLFMCNNRNCRQAQSADACQRRHQGFTCSKSAVSSSRSTPVSSAKPTRKVVCKKKHSLCVHHVRVHIKQLLAASRYALAQ